MHSIASDGVLGIDQMLEAAQEDPNIQAIGITDHDTTDALAEAQAQAAAYGVQVVPGVEITSKHNGSAVHMLGYFIDTSYQPLQAYIAENRDRRIKRSCAIAERLEAAGYPITPEDLYSSGECINRPLIARILKERGSVTSVNQAFEDLIGYDSPYFVPLVFPDALDSMRLIEEACGYSFIAHPGRSNVVQYIPELAAEGLAGVEVFYTMHSAQQESELERLAHELDLGICGGSDWHGNELHRARLGSAGLTEMQYNDFLRSCGRS